MLLDYTRIVIPKVFRSVLLAKEHISYAGKTKMYLDIVAMYFWLDWRRTQSGLWRSAWHTRPMEAARRANPCRV